jgi:hypothetical protein
VPGGKRRHSPANVAFSVFAALGSAAVAVLSAAKGAYVVSAVFGMLAIGFVFRART